MKLKLRNNTEICRSELGHAGCRQTVFKELLQRPPYDEDRAGPAHEVREGEAEGGGAAVDVPLGEGGQGILHAEYYRKLPYLLSFIF